MIHPDKSIKETTNNISIEMNLTAHSYGKYSVQIAIDQLYKHLFFNESNYSESNHNYAVEFGLI